MFRLCSFLAFLKNLRFVWFGACFTATNLNILELMCKQTKNVDNVVAIGLDLRLEKTYVNVDYTLTLYCIYTLLHILSFFGWMKRNTSSNGPTAYELKSFPLKWRCLYHAIRHSVCAIFVACFREEPNTTSFQQTRGRNTRLLHASMCK